MSGLLIPTEGKLEIISGFISAPPQTEVELRPPEGEVWEVLRAVYVNSSTPTSLTNGASYSNQYVYIGLRNADGYYSGHMQFMPPGNTNSYNGYYPRKEAEGKDDNWLINNDNWLYFYYSYSGGNTHWWHYICRKRN